jgi:hypothetical protein
MDSKIISREYVSTTRCDLMDDGYWKAVNTVHDRVLYEGDETWVDEAIECMSMDTDPTEAIKIAMNSVLQYLIQNVYQNGFSSLVEYRDFQKQLELKKAEANSDIETQSL